MARVGAWRRLPFIAYATPNFILDTDLRPASDDRPAARGAGAPRTGEPDLNYGVATSLQSWLNANALNIFPVHNQIRNYTGLGPGEGEIITLMTLGNINDATTVLRDGQRYLDVPSMALIPTYVADEDGRLDPAGTSSGQSRTLAAALLDLTMMAGRPASSARSGAARAPRICWASPTAPTFA